MNYYPATREVDTAELIRFVLKGFSYCAYGLLVVVDGMNNPESFNSKLLTIPYFVGGLALVRSFCEALDSHHEAHAALFAVGVSTLGALS